MPRISRIRIANVSYNHNNRQIGDEIFNFYEGEHALFNLANGGGKTIIIQAILQAILPKVKLLQRKAPDFLQKSGSPALILIEWKLDNNSSYLVSGISMCLKPDNSDEKSSSENIDYYTFGYEYKEANEYDIRNIELTEMLGEKTLKIKKHKEIKEYLKGLRKKGINLQIYDDDSEGQRNYSKFLKSYGIYKEEWRELVVKINEAESGISTFFSTCNSSKQLMEQWILKYIERVLEKTDDAKRTGHKKLEHMAINLINSFEENDAQIQESSALKEMIGEFESINVELKILTEKLGEKNRNLKELNGIHRFLKEKSNELNSEKNLLDSQKTELLEEKKKIEFEKTSDEYYIYLDKKNENILKFEKLESELKELTSEIDKINIEIKKVDVDRHYKEYFSKESEKKILEEQIKNQFKDSEELRMELEKIRYSIKVKLEREKEKNFFDKSKLQQYEVNLKKDKLDSKKEISNIENEIASIIKKIATLEDSITRFENEEKQLLDDLGVAVFRNPITNLLDMADKEKVLHGFMDRKEKTQGNISRTSQKIVEIKNDIKTSNENLKNMELDKQKNGITAVQLFDKLDNFKKTEIEIDILRKKYGIFKENTFDVDELKNKLDKELNNLHIRKNDNNREIYEINQFIENLNSGKSYIPASLLNLIEKSNLDIVTGEQYLNNNSNMKNKLLENIPLLPYSLILSKNEKVIMQKLLEDENLNQVIPIYDFDQLNENYRKESNTFFYNPKLVRMEKNEVEEYREEKKKNKIEIEQEQEEISGYIKSINDELFVVSQFNFKEFEVNEWKENLDKYSKNEEILKNEIEQLQNILVKNEESLSLLEVELKKIEEELRNIEKNLKSFEIYLNQDAIYISNKEEYNSCKRKQLNEENEKNTIKSRVDKIESDIIENIKILEKTNNKINELDEKLKNYIIVEEFQEEKGDLNELIIREVALKEESRDFKLLQENKVKLDRDLVSIEKTIKDLGFSIEEARNLILLKTKDELNIILNNGNSQKRETENEREKNIKNTSELEGRLNTIEEQLGENIISREDIKYNFENRIKDIEVGHQAKKLRIIQIESETKSIDRIAGKLEDYVDTNVKELLEASFDENYIDEIEIFVNNLKKSNEEIREDIKKFDQLVHKKSDKLKNYNSETVKISYNSFMESFIRLDDSYETYFYFLENIDRQIGIISNILKIFEGKLKEIENLKKELIRHCCLDAMKVYYELDKIGENSSIDFSGTKRKMLEIKYDRVEDEEIVKLKIESYVEDLLKELRIKVKELEENKLVEYVEKVFSFKELLNVICSLESFVVKAYKIDINPNNSGMVNWEAVNKENSGGERFVAYFSLLAALISYTRKKDVNIDAFSKKELGKVLIMDNPFGPITSRHLLEPMFNIANKYNMQLICFSDIKQNAIYDNFNLIYMMKVKSKTNGKEALEVNQIKNEGKNNEKLESAFIYTPKGIQKGLF